jgi:ribosome biogenesis GTPase / thiamine phosphate phosphatase
MIAAMSPDALPARLLSHQGRQALVLDETGQTRRCVYKGRDLVPTANDQVIIDTSETPAVITRIIERRNQLIRSESHRAKILAANIDQAMIVISGAPLFSDELLARMICACSAEDIPGIVVLNKIDLHDETERARAQLAPFVECLRLLGWQIHAIAAKPEDGASGHGAAHQGTKDLDSLAAALHNKTTVIMGQSGMGKSSLLNALVPGFNAMTREISDALQTGKHTTTAGQVVQFHRRATAATQDDSTGWLIDTPGFQLFGLHHLSESQMALGFPEWRAIHDHDGRCKYFNCRHINEPGCTVQAAAEIGKVDKRRLALWAGLIAD